MDPRPWPAFAWAGANKAFGCGDACERGSEEENLICIYNEAFSAGSQGDRKHREMDLFMYGFVKDFPQQLKSIQEANYALDCECEREISFNFILSFQPALYILRKRKKKKHLMST